MDEIDKAIPTMISRILQRIALSMPFIYGCPASSAPPEAYTLSSGNDSVAFFHQEKLACNVVGIKAPYSTERIQPTKDELAIILSPTQFISIKTIKDCNGGTTLPSEITVNNAILVDFDTKSHRFVGINKNTLSSKSYIAILWGAKPNGRSKIEEVYADCKTNNQNIKNQLRKISEYFDLTCTPPKNIRNEDTGSYTTEVAQVLGDLNRDGLADKALISQDRTSMFAPYRLQIFLAKSNGVFELEASSTTIAPPEFPDGNREKPPESIAPNITIEKGVLSIISESSDGRESHKFRFQDGAFRLIGYSKVYGHGGNSSSIDYNLSTGARVERQERPDDNGNIVSSERHRKLFIRPLPNIQDVLPREHDLY